MLGFYRALVVEELKNMGVADPELSVKAKGQVGRAVLDDTVGRFFACELSGSGPGGNPPPPCPATASVLGAMMAQEVIKAITHAHSPISQFLMHSSLPTDGDDGKPYEQHSAEAVTREPEEAKTVPYSVEVARELRRMRVFVVGAGAIGCELLKNFALMGVGTGSVDASDRSDARMHSTKVTGSDKSSRGKKHQSGDQGKGLSGDKGKGQTGAGSMLKKASAVWSATTGQGRGALVVTDMDVIERSNLNRQLLFRYATRCCCQ